MQDAVKLAAQYGIGGILALVLGFVVYKIGMRLITAIDEMRKGNADTMKALADAVGGMSKDVQLAIADAHAASVESIADLSERIARVELRFGIEPAPVELEERGFDPKPTPVGGGPHFEHPLAPRLQSLPYHVTRRAKTGGKP